MMTMRAFERQLKKRLHTVAVSLTLFFIMFPIAWLALTSLKNKRDAFSTQVIFEPSLANFGKLFAHPWDFEPMVAHSGILS